MRDEKSEIYAQLIKRKVKGGVLLEELLM